MNAGEPARARSGAVAGSVPFLAALLAADATSADGFRPADARFFFLLFTNWMGDDRLAPGADLDPTQVRRGMGRLVEEGRATLVPGRQPRWSLTPGGVAALVDALTDPRAARRFEEVVLLATVASSYAEIIAARARAGGRAEERTVRARLDARAILRAEKRRLADALDDMRARRDAAPELAAKARAALAGGADPVEAAGRMGRLPYQLHPMRPLPELVAALPPALRRFEVAEGIELRARRMFGPLAEELEARLGVIERMLAEVQV